MRLLDGHVEVHARPRCRKQVERNDDRRRVDAVEHGEREHRGDGHARGVATEDSSVGLSLRENEMWPHELAGVGAWFGHVFRHPAAIPARDVDTAFTIDVNLVRP